MNWRYVKGIGYVDKEKNVVFNEYRRLMKMRTHAENYGGGLSQLFQSGIAPSCAETPPIPVKGSKTGRWYSSKEVVPFKSFNEMLTENAEITPGDLEAAIQKHAAQLYMFIPYEEETPEEMNVDGEGNIVADAPKVRWSQVSDRTVWLDEDTWKLWGNEDIMASDIICDSDDVTISINVEVELPEGATEWDEETGQTVHRAFVRSFSDPVATHLQRT